MESRESFEKPTVLAVGVSVRTLQLVQAREGSQLGVGQVFSVKEVEVHRVLSTTLEGRTEQQKNPHQGVRWLGQLGSLLDSVVGRDMPGSARLGRSRCYMACNALSNSVKVSNSHSSKRICAYHSCPDQGLRYGKWSFERLLHPSKLLKSKKYHEKGQKRPDSLRRKWD